MNTHMNISRNRGFSIIEVMIGILIFAVGMLSLALLQGSLTRSQADSNSRAVAVNLAEEVIELARGFADDAGYTAISVGNINPGTQTVAGLSYTADLTLLDYQWDGDSFECYQGQFGNGTDSRCIVGTPPGPDSAYKLIEVTVNWNEAGAPEFRIDDATTTTGQLGSGSVTLSSIVSSVPTGVSARLQTTDDGGSILPPIAIPENFLNDNVSVALGNNKFKSSTYASPDTFKKQDDFVETRWDVVTYSSSPGNQFLRREEMIAVSCECDLDGTGDGRRPVVWAGDEYIGGEIVQKTIGENKHKEDSDVSRYCNACCRDHHDESGADYSEQYSPFVGTPHNHYESSNGELSDPSAPVIAAGSDSYLEACRLVRVDGFFRVAQDLRQEQFFNFPSTWIADTSAGGGLNTYSSYVTDSVTGYEVAADTIGSAYPATPPSVAAVTYDGADVAELGLQPGVNYPDADTFPAWWAMSQPLPLAARGLYVDYMSDDLRAVIDCVEGLSDGETVDDLAAGCKVGGYAGVGDVILDRTGSLNPLEIMPFFDTQLTSFADWRSQRGNSSPVTVTNDALAVGGTHSRGRVVRNANQSGQDTIQGWSFKDNLGLIDSRTHETPDFIHRPGSQVGTDQADMDICAVLVIAPVLLCPPAAP